LPIYGNVFPSCGNDIGIPSTSTDFDILVVGLGLFTVYVTVFRLGISSVAKVGWGKDGVGARRVRTQHTGLTKRDMAAVIIDGLMRVKVDDSVCFDGVRYR